MSRLRFLAILFLLFWGIPDRMIAQERIVQPFFRLDLPKSFPNKFINDMARDPNGLLWIGTTNGLCRYISENDVKVYSSKEVEALKSNYIEVLLFDSKGNLWIGTRHGGITRYEPKQEKWTTYKYLSEDPNSLGNNDVLCLMEDRKGRVWIGTEKGVSIYREETDDFVRFRHDSKDTTSLSANAILSITEDREGRIWLGSWAGGMNLFVPHKEEWSKSTFKRIPLINKDGNQEAVWKVFQDSQDRFWVCSHFSGLYLMQLPSNKEEDPEAWTHLPRFHNYSHDPEDPNSLVGDIDVRDIGQDSKGNIWIATAYGLAEIPSNQLPDPMKYNQFTLEKPIIKFHQHLYDPLNVRTINSNKIQSIFVDVQDLVWIGTDRGITQYNWFAKQIRSYQVNSSLYTDVNIEEIFIPEKDHAILCYDSGEVVHFNLQSGENKPVHEVYGFIEPINDAMNFVEVEEGVLYIVRLSGITKIDFYSRTQSELLTPKPILGLLKAHRSKAVCVTRDEKKGERIWIGSEKGLFVIKNGGKDYEVFTKNEHPNSISDNSTSGITQDQYGQIWITTYGGLNLVKEEGDSISFQRFLHDMEDPQSLPIDRLISIVSVRETLIIGSRTGLVGYNLIEGAFFRIGEEQHSQMIISLLAVNKENVWASTLDKILNYHIPSGQIFEYGDMEISFREGAIYSDHSGAIYVGGFRGFVGFEPDKIVKNEMAPSVIVTEVSTLSPARSTTKEVTATDTITLAHDNYQLSISFSSSNFNQAEENKFAYRMVGFDDTWVYTYTNQPVVYTNLEHGIYQFEVKGSNNDGVWSHEPEVLHVIVEPAFWETFVFKIFAITGGIILIYFFTNFYTKNVRNQNQKLLVEITKRKQFEEELTFANTELEKSNRELEQFAFVASHDLKEPLQTIDSFSSLLRRKEFQAQLGENGVKYIEFISQSSTRMMQIIKSLLSYSTTRQEELAVQECDFNEMLQNIRSDLSEYIREKKAHIEIGELPKGYCDPVQIRMVFSNLIMNGIKFNSHQKPQIQVWGMQLPNGKVEFAVKDNGIGIEEEFHEKIFGIFKRLHSRDRFEGSGIGLALCYKIIERHQGKIWIESKLGEGSTFRFVLGKLLPNKVESALDYEVISTPA